MRIRKSVIFLLACIFLNASIIIALSIGSANIGFLDLFNGQNQAILMLRIARIALAGIAGASLAVVGAILQGLLKNPLADPYVLGISSWSGLGVVLAIALSAGVSGISLPFFGFCGGIITIFLVYALSKKGSRVKTEDLLLSGVIVSAILSSIIMFIVSVMEAEHMHNVVWWLLGNTQIFHYRALYLIGFICLICIIIGTLLARNLNIMSLGEEQAISMGLNIERLKILYFILCSILTAAVVSVCGLIGFVGLIVPHIGRRLIGPDHRDLIPFVALCGSSLLIICDIAARTVITPQELPIGVVTALVGGPFFVILLKRSRRVR